MGTGNQANLVRATGFSLSDPRTWNRPGCLSPSPMTTPPRADCPSIFSHLALPRGFSQARQGAGPPDGHGSGSARSHSFTARQGQLTHPHYQGDREERHHAGATGENTEQTQFLPSQLQSMSSGWFCAPRARLATGGHGARIAKGGWPRAPERAVPVRVCEKTRDTVRSAMHGRGALSMTCERRGDWKV